MYNCTLPYNQVYLELTNACNCACRFCPQPRMQRPVQYMNLGLAKRLISEINAHQLSRRITFHVLGEPSLHPAFFDILDFANRLDMHTSLVTNGMLLHDDFGHQLRTRTLDELTISLQTAGPLSYIVRNAPVSFNTYKQGILDFIRDTYPSWHDCQYIIRFLSTHFLEKVHKLDAIYGNVCSDFKSLKQAMKVWARELYKAIGTGTQDADQALLKLEKTQVDQCNRIHIYPGIRFDVMHMLEWIDWSLSPGAPEVKNGDCLHRKDDIAILSNGEVVLCCLDFNGRTSMGNVSNVMLKDIMNSDKVRYVLSEFKQGRVALPICRKCIGSWQASLKALHLCDPVTVTQKTLYASLENECRVW